MRLALVILAFALTSPGQSASPEPDRAELLDRIEALQRRKFATGHCSPFRILEFEKEVAALDEGKRRKFSREWEELREHPLWTSVEDLSDGQAQ
jgi:hypothetical protein